MGAIIFTVKTVPIENPELEELFEENSNSIKETFFQSDRKILEAKIWHPSFSKVLGIGIASIDNKTDPEYTILQGDEKDILSSFGEGCKSFNGPFVSYDGLWFDIPFLLGRYAALGIDPPNSSFCNQIKFRSFPHYDVSSLYSSWGRFPTSLPLLAHTFGLKYDEPVSYLAWLKTATEKDIEKMLKERVEVILKIYLKMKKVFG